MRSTRLIWAAKISYALLSAAFCALGIAMLSRPGFSAGMIGWVTGAALVAFGIARLVGFLSRDLYRLAFQHDSVLGTIAIALGLVLILRRGVAVEALCLVLGVGIAADGLFKIKTALDAKRFGLNTWWLVLLLAAISTAVGVWLALSPAGGRLLVCLTGASLLALGALNLCVALCAIKIIPHQVADAAGM